MLQKLIFGLTFIALFVSNTDAKKQREKAISSEKSDLVCPPCSRIFCPKSDARQKCRGGITTDICNCCPKCARVEDETCGGDWNYLGKCDVGLTCEPDHGAAPLVTGVGTRQGTCQKRRLARQATDETASERESVSTAVCAPECTPAYCKNNKHAVCSARVNAIGSSLCNGHCLHTSCEACAFHDASPNCPKCRPDDFGCLRKFGRCMRRASCTKLRFPCKPGYALESEAGEFQCKLPQCLTIL